LAVFILLAMLSQTKPRIEKLARKNTGSTVALLNDDRCIKISDHSLSFVSPLIERATDVNGHLCEKHCCSWRGVTTRCRGAILGNK